MFNIRDGAGEKKNDFIYRKTRLIVSVTVFRDHAVDFGAKPYPLVAMGNHHFQKENQP